MHMLRNSLLLLAAICTAGFIYYLATFSHGPANSSSLVVGAVCVSAMGCAPPLWLSLWISQGPPLQLAVIVLRLGVLMPAVGLSSGMEVAERNYFLAALLACYFVALPLESWLLIRDVRRTLGP